MNYLLLIILLSSASCSLLKTKSQTNKSSENIFRKTAFKKASRLEEVSKSTALIISGVGSDRKTGSGFFIGKSLLITNSHVVENALVQEGVKIVFIETQEGIKDAGVVFIEDIKNDLAIIKTVKNIHKALKLGKYNKVKMGDEIFVFGSPQGLIGTLSKGIVSAKRKAEGFQLLQITAPISQGSSGSPVLSKDLKVIGVAATILKESQNINFAVPISYLKKLMKSNRKKLREISKLDLEKIIGNSKAQRSIEDKKFKDLKTDYEKGIYYYNRNNDKQAFYWFQKAAKQGDAPAQANLGAMYQLGRGVPKNYKQAIYWLQKAAKQGNDLAQYALGRMYQLGQGVPQNDKQAFEWYQKAAKQGYAPAQYILGAMYELGQGVPKNDKQAIYWLQKAAKQGDALAQSDLGAMYQLGQGVPQNDKQAFEWYQKAAKQGYAPAQYLLGMIYELGQGVPKNDKQAIYWLQKAAKQGYDLSQFILGAKYELGQGVPKNYKQAIYWLQKAAKQGNDLAQYALGRMYQLGQGVPQNDKQAFEWYQKAAKQGYAPAQYALGRMYELGQGVPKNDKQAIYWLQKAAKQGDALAQSDLGAMYQLGRGVPKNYKQAFEWYQKAAKQGDAPAQYALGRMYELGQGVPKNYIHAYSWINLAISNGNKGAIKLRNKLEETMSSNQIAKAQKLSSQTAKEIAQGQVVLK